MQCQWEVDVRQLLKQNVLFTFYILIIIKHWIFLQKYNQLLNNTFHA